MQGYLMFRKEIEDAVEADDTAIWMDENEIAPIPLKNDKSLWVKLWSLQEGYDRVEIAPDLTDEDSLAVYMNLYQGGSRRFGRDASFISTLTIVGNMYAALEFEDGTFHAISSEMLDEGIKINAKNCVEYVADNYMPEASDLTAILLEISDCLTYLSYGTTYLEASRYF